MGDRSRANTRLAPTVTTACCISGEDKKLAPAAVPANSLRGRSLRRRERSAVNYDGISGTAQGSFPGHRWLASGGLTGLYRTQWLHFEPSARVYAKRDDSYVDSLGTPQAENSFSTGRASAGAKVTYPIMWNGTASLLPYVGLYADYYFSSDNAALLLPTQFVQGWAARTTAGLSYSAPGGAKIVIGGELGGLGSQDFTT